jgi:DNA-binding NtrC family response regulator
VASARKGRFVVVDCAGTEAEALDSELFGHGAGAFPGAEADRCGRLSTAHDGTLYLDEVSFLPAATQARLAQFLAEQATQSRGSGQRPARVIAGTASDIETRVTSGHFHGALLAQLGLVRLGLPPLRARNGDIGVLSRHFGDRFAAENDMTPRPFSDEAMALLHNHDWPGNIAELQDVVHRAVLICPEKTISAAAIMLADGGKLGGKPEKPVRASSPTGQIDGFVGSTVFDVERALILETLKACSGNRTSASTILGISVRTMRNKLKAFVESGLFVSPTL